MGPAPQVPQRRQCTGREGLPMVSVIAGVGAAGASDGSVAPAVRAGRGADALVQVAPDYAQLDKHDL
eukprot:7965562-Pyramimonas_sp.AAC.1